jgi:hypothetical protein
LLRCARNDGLLLEAADSYTHRRLFAGAGAQAPAGFASPPVLSQREPAQTLSLRARPKFVIASPQGEAISYTISTSPKNGAITHIVIANLQGEAILTHD